MVAFSQTKISGTKDSPTGALRFADIFHCRVPTGLARVSLRKPLRQFISAPERFMRRLPYAPIVALLLASAVFPLAAVGQTLPAGFQQSAVFTGLTQPTAVKFASDGRVFVAEKSGLIKVFDNLSDPTPTIFADLRTNVHNFWDRGLLGLELHPNFPSSPYVYVLYALDAPIGGTAPRWGVAGVTTDPCPTPPGPTSDGCVVGARLSRLTASGNFATGPETVFLENWCQQYPSHSIGTIAFGSDGALYVTGGDGASFNFVDYGQDGAPLNPCGDPPSGVGGTKRHRRQRVALSAVRTSRGWATRPASTGQCFV